MIGKHLLAWFGIACLAVANGATRDVLYKPFVGELSAHQASTILLVVIIGIAAWFVQSRWPLRTLGEAATVGVCWMLQTIAFEFFIGHIVAGKPWDTLLHDYDVAAGRIWVFIPVWLAIVPSLLFLRRTRGGSAGV